MYDYAALWAALTWLRCCEIERTHLEPCICVTGLMRLWAMLLVTLATSAAALPLLSLSLLPVLTHLRRRTKSPTLLSALPPALAYSKCLHVEQVFFINCTHAKILRTI